MKKNISKYDERLDFIFGKFSQKIKLYHEHQAYNNKTLIPYNYFTKQNLLIMMVFQSKKF